MTGLLAVAHGRPNRVARGSRLVIGDVPSVREFGPIRVRQHGVNDGTGELGGSERALDPGRGERIQSDARVPELDPPMPDRVVVQSRGRIGDTHADILEQYRGVETAEDAR